MGLAWNNCTTVKPQRHSPTPRHRPGARSARRGHGPRHCIAGRFVIGDRTMFNKLAIGGRTALSTRPHSLRRWHAKPRLERLEDRLAPATLTANTTVDDPTSPITTALTLRDAITLVNNAGNPASLGQSTMPGGWASQIDTTSPFGTSDTINFNIPTSDTGYTAPTSVAVTNVSLSNNVATLTTSAQVPVALGETVIVAGLSNAIFNGNFQVSAVTPSSLSCTLVHADVASTPDSGTASNAPRFA